MTELISTSIFEPIQCPKSFINTIYSSILNIPLYLKVLNKYIDSKLYNYINTSTYELVKFYEDSHTCYGSKPINSWIQMCGIVRTAFSLSEGYEEHQKKTMIQALYRVASVLKENPNGAILILDDFNFCLSKCKNILRDLIKTSALSTSDGEVIAAHNLIIIIASDLSEAGYIPNEGDINDHESYIQELQKIKLIAEDYWDDNDRLFITKTKLVPFAPLSDEELKWIINKVIREFSIIIKNHIDYALITEQKLSNSNSIKYKWVGSFICTPDTTNKIIDIIRDLIIMKSARAIVEDFKGALNMLVSEPIPLHELFIEKAYNKYFNQKDNIWEYNVDILLEINENVEIEKYCIENHFKLIFQ